MSTYSNNFPKTRLEVIMRIVHVLIDLFCKQGRAHSRNETCNLFAVNNYRY